MIIARARILAMFFSVLVVAALLASSMATSARADEVNAVPRGSYNNGVTLNGAFSADQRVNAVGGDEICLLLGIGTGANATSKAINKGLKWLGIGAAIGCYTYTKMSQVTPAQSRAAVLAAYNEYNAKSAIGKLSALGYSCTKQSGGGGGTDAVAPSAVVPMIGYRTIIMKGVSYKCGNLYD